MILHVPGTTRASRIWKTRHFEYSNHHTQRNTLNFEIEIWNQQGKRRKMKKRAKVNGKSSSSASPESPNRSPKSNKIASASAPKQKSNYKYKKPMASALLSPSPPPRAPMNFGNKTLSNISDLKEMAFSRLDDQKRNLIERSHSEILKDLEASHSRLHKRFKVNILQNNKCSFSIFPKVLPLETFAYQNTFYQSRLISHRYLSLEI